MDGVPGADKVPSFDRLMLCIAEKLAAMACDLETNQAKLSILTWDAFRHDADYVKILQNADLLSQNLIEIGKLIRILSDNGPSTGRYEIEAALGSISLQSLASDLSTDQAAPVGAAVLQSGDLSLF